MDTYREGPNSTFTHYGKLYSVDKLLELTQDIPTEKCPVIQLMWILEYDHPLTKEREDRIDRADLSIPIRITDSDRAPVVLDGIHRLRKAVRGCDSSIKVKKVSDEILTLCLIK